MKKIIGIVFLWSLCCFSADAQGTRLKWNAAYWVAGVTNMSVETRITDKITFNGDVVYSPWQSISGNPMELMQIIPEWRFYPKGSFNGFYVGAYTGFHRFFKMTKWNYINTDYYQRGVGYSLGAVVGYQIEINTRWSLDVYAGGGFQESGYRGYKTSTGEQLIAWNRSGEWIPYKLGISFAWKPCVNGASKKK